MYFFSFFAIKISLCFWITKSSVEFKTLSVAQQFHLINHLETGDFMTSSKYDDSYLSSAETFIQDFLMIMMPLQRLVQVCIHKLVN